MNSSRQSFRPGEIQPGDLADAAQAVLEGVAVHGSARRSAPPSCRARTTPPACAATGRRGLAAQAPQRTAQFVGPPALAQAGRQHRQGEFVSRVDSACGDGVARPAAWRARTARNRTGPSSPPETATEGQDGLAVCPRRPGVRARAWRRLRDRDAAAARASTRQAHAASPARRQAGLLLGERPAQALLRARTASAASPMSAISISKATHGRGEIDAETVCPSSSPAPGGTRRSAAGPVPRAGAGRTRTSDPPRLLQHGLCCQTDQFRRAGGQHPVRRSGPHAHHPGLPRAGQVDARSGIVQAPRRPLSISTARPCASTSNRHLGRVPMCARSPLAMISRARPSH